MPCTVHSRFVRSAALACGFLAFLLVIRPSAPAIAVAGLPVFDHIFVIVMENHAYSEIIGNTGEAPYINQLAGQYGVAANDVAVSHPSLPNYLALIGGSTFGITTDCTNCFINATNLAADRIAPSGRSWRAYMEDMPSSCYIGDASAYAQKHDPFVYFNDIRTTSQCDNVVPFTTFAGDLGSASTTPNFVWVTPNLCNDMHDCSVGTGDGWLQNMVPTILNSPAYTSQNSLVVITWDEDDGSASNQVATLVIAKAVPPGFQSSIPYTHYSLLRTIEQSWGLASMTTNDGNASPLSDFFPSGVSSTPTSTPTLVPRATLTTIPTPTDTPTALPTNTLTSLPTSKLTPLPTSTLTPLPTSTRTPLPTSTLTSPPTSTLTPLPTSTLTPLPTNTLAPMQTSTATPIATATIAAAGVVPGPPTNVIAVRGRRSATVSWQSPASDGGCAINNYVVTSSSGGVTTTTIGTASSLRVGNLMPGTTYTFTVAATNCAGTGPNSVPSNPVVPKR